MTTKTRGFPVYSIKGKQVEYKSFRFQVKSIDEAQGQVTGYLSTYNNIDLQKDAVQMGAFKKTLQDAYARKQSGRQYLFAILWMHDPEQPIGGFIDAKEDKQGLLVTAQLDISVNAAGIPNNPRATMVFSGFKAGYIDEMSMGYIAIQKEYQQGVRLLKEVQLIEGSAITMLFAANPEALVPASGVKSLPSPRQKGASGKTTWPLGARDAAWDNGAAHARIVAWATKSDGSLDTGKMKSVHFWYDDANASNITAYKLLFCDQVDGAIEAMPRGIFACAGSHGIDAADIPDGDVAGVKSKIEAYYKKMAKEFDDDSIQVPWSDDTGKRGRFRVNRKDFSDHYQEECIEDWLWSDFNNLTTALRQSLIDIFLIGDTPMDDLQNTILEDSDGGAGFISALKAFVQKGIDLEVSDYLSELISDNPGCTPDNVLGYMRRKNPDLAHKAGRTISAATQKAIEQHQAEMKAMLDEHQQTMADSCKAMAGKVSDLTQLWNEEGQGPAYSNDSDDTGKSRFARTARREPPAKALPRTAGKPISPRAQPGTPTVDAALDELVAMLGIS